ncbi:MAG: HAD hydrolase-like protein [Bryobacterales bacterium]|nr:HAD hydrolase-like protein [Bryobacterales bacterium]
MPYELWIDADDTLWENNVFFERAFEEFVNLLSHSCLNASQVREILDEIEHANNRIHGYGAANFARNLSQCFDKLCERPVCDADRARIRRFGEQLANHPIDIIPGVVETLEHLSARHTLMLFTKGNPVEQQAKVDRSGLKPYFHRVQIVKEKDVPTYHATMAAHGSRPEDCWMIGNSPKSDINPALAAGLGAVYIPHPRTWHLEHESVPDTHDRLRIVDRFAALQSLF